MGDTSSERQESQRFTSRLGLNRLVRDSALTFARYVLVSILQLAMAVVLARLLGPAGNGQYNVALLLPTLFGSLLAFGIPVANVYFVARDRTSVGQVLRANILIWVMVSSIGGLAGIVLIAFFGERIFPQVPENALWFSLGVFPILLLSSLLNSVIQGLQEFRRLSLVLLAAPAVALCTLFTTVRLLSMGLLGALISFAVGHVVAIVLAWNFVKSYAGACRQNSFPSILATSKDLTVYGTKAHLSNVLTLVNNRADVFLVNLLVSPLAAGVYVIALQLAERFWMLSLSVSTVLLPRVSELHDSDSSRRELTPAVARAVFLLTGVGSLVFVLIGKWVIGFLFGAEYADAYYLMLWLMPGIILGSVSRVLSNDISGRGRPELNIVTSVVVVIVNIFGNLLLIPRLGVVGGHFIIDTNGHEKSSLLARS